MNDTSTGCRFCGHPTTSGAEAHWNCGGILPERPHDAAVSVADHIVRMLRPRQTLRADGTYRKNAPPVLSEAQLRGQMRPELLDAFDEGLGLALAAKSVRRDGKGLRLGTNPRRRQARPQRDNGTEPGLFDLT